MFIVELTNAYRERFEPIERECATATEAAAQFDDLAMVGSDCEAENVEALEAGEVVRHLDDETQDEVTARRA